MFSQRAVPVPEQSLLQITSNFPVRCKIRAAENTLLLPAAPSKNRYSPKKQSVSHTWILQSKSRAIAVPSQTPSVQINFFSYLFQLCSADHHLFSIIHTHISVLHLCDMININNTSSFNLNKFFTV